MGKKDITLKDYLSDGRRYADLLNGSIFQGRQVIRGEMLTDANTVQAKSEDKTILERTNDIVMKQTADGKLFAVWVVANQEHIDYTMPVRVMLQESLEYDRQLKEIRRQNRRNEKIQSKEDKVFQNDAEFLSGIRRKDRLQPVVTLVVYWGKEKWQGAQSLHDIIDFGEDVNLAQNMKLLVPKYPLHFLNLTERNNYDCFQTELRILFELYARRNNKLEFWNYVNRHEECKQLDKETYQTLGVLTNSKRLQNGIYIRAGKQQETEEVNMCQAIEELIEDGKKEGQRLGRQRMLYELVRDGMLSAEAAARKASMTKQDFLMGMKRAGFFIQKNNEKA